MPTIAVSREERPRRALSADLACRVGIESGRPGESGIVTSAGVAYRGGMDRWAGLDSAPQLAASLLGTDSRRFRHTVGVASAAHAAAPAVPEDVVELLVAAAWLHDIGYAEAVADTGFHPLDGARYLERIGAPQRLCRLVAHHTGSPVEARVRGLLDELTGEFPAEQSPTADALTYADMTTGPDGTPISAVERVSEILVRYPHEHVVHSSITMAAPLLLSTVARVELRIAAAHAPVRPDPDPDPAD